MSRLKKGIILHLRSTTPRSLDLLTEMLLPSDLRHRAVGFRKNEEKYRYSAAKIHLHRVKCTIYTASSSLYHFPLFIISRRYERRNGQLPISGDTFRFTLPIKWTRIVRWEKPEDEQSSRWIADSRRGQVLRRSTWKKVIVYDRHRRRGIRLGSLRMETGGSLIRISLSLTKVRLTLGCYLTRAN